MLGVADCGAFLAVGILQKSTCFTQSEVSFTVFKQQFSALFKTLEQTDSSCRTTGLTDSAPALRTSPPVSCSRKIFIEFYLHIFASFCSSQCSFFVAGIITWFVPCYTFGKNAEQLGENCVMYGLSYFVPILNFWCRTQIRGKIREQKGIEGSCIKDLLCVLFCDLCALVQESRVSDCAACLNCLAELSILLVYCNCSFKLLCVMHFDIATCIQFMNVQFRLLAFKTVFLWPL